MGAGRGHDVDFDVVGLHDQARSVDVTDHVARVSTGDVRGRKAFPWSRRRTLRPPPVVHSVMDEPEDEEGQADHEDAGGQPERDGQEVFE